MQRSCLVLCLAGILLFTACQPQEIIIENTRIVEVKGEDVIVEVTRIVQETVVVESTQAVTNEVVVEEATRMDTDEAVVEVTRSPLGSAARPVQLLFSPVAETTVINQRASLLAEALREETGYEFAVGILDDEAAVIEMMCTGPMETIGFLSPGGYVLAEEKCGAVAGNVAVHEDGLTWGAGMLVTRRGEGIAELADLAGKSWAVADQESMSNFLYFQALLEDAGVEPGEIVPVSGESAAMLALNDGEVDFATAEFIPPIMPYEETIWDYDEDPPEPNRYLGIPPQRSPIGYILVNGEPEFGGYRLRDARSRVFDVAPEIYNRTGILTLSAQIPNEIVAFGSDFPLRLSQDLVTLLADFAASEACGDSICATDFYAWTGLEPVTDGAYDPVRFIKETLSLTENDVLELAR